MKLRIETADPNANYIPAGSLSAGEVQHSRTIIGDSIDAIKRNADEAILEYFSIPFYERYEVDLNNIWSEAEGEHSKYIYVCSLFEYGGYERFRVILAQ